MKILSTILLFSTSLFTFTTAFAKKVDLKPTISLLAGGTIIKNYSRSIEGDVNVSNLSFNHGFQIMDKFHLNKNNYIATGLRINFFKNNVTAFNLIKTTISYSNLAVPIHYTKTFDYKNKLKGSFYGGFSFGMLILNTQKLGTLDYPNYNGMNSTLFNNSDWLFVTKFMSTLDFGINVHPFNKIPKMSLGINCNIQLNKSFVVNYAGSIENQATNSSKIYNVNNQFKTFGIVGSIGYQLGK